MGSGQERILETFSMQKVFLLKHRARSPGQEDLTELGLGGATFKLVGGRGG